MSALNCFVNNINTVIIIIISAIDVPCIKVDYTLVSHAMELNSYHFTLLWIVILNTMGFLLVYF